MTLFNTKGVIYNEYMNSYSYLDKLPNYRVEKSNKLYSRTEMIDIRFDFFC